MTIRAPRKIHWRTIYEGSTPESEHRLSVCVDNLTVWVCYSHPRREKPMSDSDIKAMIERRYSCDLLQVAFSWRDTGEAMAGHHERITEHRITGYRSYG